MFEREFSLSARDASELLISSSHLLGNGEELRTNLEAVLKPSLNSFTSEQLESAIDLIKKTSEIDSSASNMQREILENATTLLNARLAPKEKWS